MEHFRIAKPLAQRTSSGTLLQLQQSGESGRPEPAYDLIKKSHKMDLREAAVVDREGKTIAVFRSGGKNKFRSASSKLHLRRSVSSSDTTLHHSTDCAGYLDILSRKEGRLRWDVHAIARGFEFTRRFGTDEISLRWVKQTDNLRRAGTAEIHPKRPVRTISDSSLHKTSKPTYGLIKSSSLSSLPTKEQHLWICRIRQPGGTLNDRRIAYLDSDELVLSFPQHSRIVTPERRLSCQVSSALWVLLHTTEQRRRPYVSIANWQSMAPPIKSAASLAVLEHAEPHDQEMSTGTASESHENSVGAAKGTAVVEGSDLPQSSPVDQSKLRLSTEMIHGKTRSPTCLTFLQSFKIFSPRSTRQGLPKSIER